MLANSSLSYGGVSVALGASDATPAFDLSDATSLPIVAGTTGTLSVARGGTGATTASGARTNLNVDVAGTDNSTDVTLVTTSYDYLSLSGQAITLGQIDIGDDTNLVGGTGITLTGDTLSTTDSEIVHDNLSGFVANEHIDHSGVSITAGAGLTGGGDITSTRDIAVGAGTGVTVNADDIAIGQDVATSADVEFNSVTADIIGDIRGATKFTAKADVALNIGDAVYISGVSGNTPTVDIADANDASKMPSFGLAGSSVSINGSVEIFTFGTLPGLNTSSFSVGDILYVSTNGTSGNTLTATKPTGESSLLQNIGTVQRSHASAGSIKVGGAGRTNATPNLDDGDIFIGNGSNQAVTAALNTKIQDYLNTGVNLPSPTFTGDINFTDASTPSLDITDTTNTITTRISSNDSTGNIGTSTDHQLNILRNNVGHFTLYSNYTMHNNVGNDLDFRAKDSSSNVVFKVDAGTSTTEIGTLSVTGNSVLAGDLQVNGTTTTVNQTNLDVSDNIIGLNRGAASNANDSGLIIERGSTGDNVFIGWDESLDRIRFATTAADASSTGDLSLTNANIHAGRLYADVTGDVTGNADTATTLATARNFSLTGDVTAGAVSFDGSGNVALSTTIAANSVALGTDTTGNYMSDLTEGTGIDITHTPAEGSNATITLDLTEVGFGGGANRLITDDGDGTVTAEANLTYSSLTLQIPSADGKVSVDKIEGYSNNTNSLFLNDDQTAANNMVSLQSINHINIMTDGNNNGVGDFRVYNGSYDIDTADLVFKVDSSGVLTSTDSSESMEYTPSNNYLTIHETGATKGSHLRLATDNSDFILSAGGSANQLSLYDVNGTANRLVVNSSGRFQFQQDISIPVAKRLYFGGSDHTYISEDIDDRLRFFVGGAEMFRLNEINDFASFFTDVAMASGDKLYLDGGSDTYIFEESADNVIHYVGGQNKLRFNSTGTILNDAGLALDFRVEGDTDPNLLFVDGSADRVGIGTTSPVSKLDLGGSTSGQRLTFSNTGVNTTDGARTQAEIGYKTGSYGGAAVIKILTETAFDDSMALAFHTGTSAAETMRIDSNQNVGIGTTSPSAKLDVRGNVSFFSPDASDFVSFTHSDNGIIINSAGSTSNKMFLRTGGSDALTIDASQNVGIGTISPSKKFVVKGASGDQARFEHNGAVGAVDIYSGTDGGLINVRNASGTSIIELDGRTGNLELPYGRITDAGTDMNIVSDNALTLGTESGTALTIPNASTNVGIGTASPDSKLQVEYTTTSNGSAAIAEFGTSGSGAIANSGHQVIVGGPSVSGYTGMMIYSDSTSGVGQISFADGRGANDSWRGTIAYEHANDRMEFWTNATEKIAINSDGDFIPAGDGTQDLGASSKRWGVIYSADLDLSNEGSQNDVDGTWGSYVIQEGEDDLFLINRRNGKKYKFMLQEVQD